MSIQANVNQIISLSTLIATQNPGVKAAGEKRAALKTNEQALRAAEEGIATARYAQESNAAKSPEERTRPEPIAPLYKERNELLEERFKLDPTIENWEELHKGRGMAKLFEAVDTAKQGAWDKEVEQSFNEMRAQVEAREKKQTGAKAPKASPSAQARTKSEAALQEAQDSRRETRDPNSKLGRISVDWRPYM